jgi:2-amino-4-hydroxy-6-hydroxymethyldihydropteridine diphosphokinase
VTRSPAAIGIGSNLGDAAANVERAVACLGACGEVTARSSLYRTKAWGERGQPDFVNAAVLLETELAPRPLLAALKTIERDLGRTPSYRWGPRAIDLDILTFGGCRVSEPELTIPHPRLLDRAFVLVPLAEIDGTFAAARDALGKEALAEVEFFRGPNPHKR